MHGWNRAGHDVAVACVFVLQAFAVRVVRPDVPLAQQEEAAPPCHRHLGRSPMRWKPNME
jgi:hypothetical protein